jgi:RluA family pseudouridine synthase
VEETKLLKTTVPDAAAGVRLDEFVRSWIAEELGRPLPRSVVRRLIMAGAVSLNGAPKRGPGATLRPQQRIEARLRLAVLADGPRDVAFTLRERDVLYEDDGLLAIDKPAGLPFHPTADAARPSLVVEVRRFLAARAGGHAQPYLAVHQRLDRETSGVALFAKTREVNAALAAAFAEHRVLKIYHTLTERPNALPPRAWSVENELALVGTGRKARVRGVATGGQRSRTEFTLLKALRGALLIEARPRTGRRHQIRAHLAEGGFAILGDTRYGARGTGIGVPRVMLHARRIELPHPVTGALLSIESQYPTDFRDALGRLSAPGPPRSAPPGRRR